MTQFTQTIEEKVVMLTAMKVLGSLVESVEINGVTDITIIPRLEARMEVNLPPEATLLTNKIVDGLMFHLFGGCGE